MSLRLMFVIALVFSAAAPAAAQAVSQRGFVEAAGTFYPQAARNDDTRAAGEALFREEASWRARSWLTFAGALDARADTHARVEREWALDWSDRGIRRPALSVRRASVALRGRGVLLEAGKQFIRWGKADVLNPTDRFAPRDFLEVVNSEFLGVTAGRLAWERGQDTVEAVWVPRFTPSRIPLLSQRWAGESSLTRLPLVDLGARYPARSQVGIRWNRVASRGEFSVSAYDGFDHLPAFDARFVAAPVPRPDAPMVIEFTRVYPRLRMLGADGAVPTRWVTVKGEAAYFTSPEARRDEYLAYVVQLERQAGEWFFVGGYAGEVVRTRRASPGFTPDRGLANTFLGRASYTIDVNRSVAFEGAVRRNGNGTWLQSEYSQTAGRHWRATLRVNLVAGRVFDFLGQYRRNSNLDVSLRYSF